MVGSVIGSLRADLSASIAQFQTDMGKAGDAVEQFAKRAKTVSRDLGKLGEEMSLALTAPLVAFGVEAVKAASALESASARVQATLASMGNHSGKTFEDLTKAADDLAKNSLFSSKDILSGVTANLLRFGNIGGKTFDQAQLAAVNLASAMKTDLPSAAQMIGKALNDPINGVKSLTREGIQFTKAQQDQVKAMVRSGDGLGAQQVILDKLTQAFGNAGKAALDASPTAALQKSWDNLKEDLGAIVEQYLPPLVKLLDELIAKFEGLSPGMKNLVVLSAAFAAAIGPILVYISMVLRAGVVIAEVFGKDGLIADAVVTIGDLLEAIGALIGSALTPLIVVIGAVVLACVEFRSVIMDAVNGVVQAFQQGLGQDVPALLAKLEDLFTQLTTGPMGDFFKVAGYLIAEFVGLVVSGIGTTVLDTLDALVKMWTMVATVVSDAIGVVVDLLNGNWAKAWTDAEQMVSDFFDGVLKIVDAFIPQFSAMVEAAYTAAVTWFTQMGNDALGIFNSVFPGLVDIVKWAAGAAGAWFKSIWQQAKTWINDNLGPVIGWAMDRLGQLAAFFGKTLAAANAALPKLNEPPKAKVQVAPKPMSPQLPTDFNQGTAAKGAKSKVPEATKEYAKQIQNLTDQVSKGLDAISDPKAMVEANALVQKIDEATTAAAKAGVNVGAFASQVDALKKSIAALEIAGLQKEAEAFAKEVAKDGVQVNEFAKGGLAPLQAALQTVDDKYDDLKVKIQAQIDANKVLAANNATAAAAMVQLQKDLVDLGNAHDKARAAAEAHYAIEEKIRDLQAQGSVLEISNQTRDLNQSVGKGAGGVQTSDQAKVQAAEDQLAKTRIQAASQLQTFQDQYNVAQEQGNTSEMARLQTQIDAQKLLLTTANQTSAVQQVAMENQKQAWSQFVDGLSEQLGTMIVNWKFDLDGLKNVFAQLAEQMFIKPFLTSAGNFLSSALTSMMPTFGGAHAKGGQLDKGKWGIVGEKGPEAIYAANANLQVVPNDQLMGGGQQASPNITFNVMTPDANSFRMSQRQLARTAKAQLATS